MLSDVRGETYNDKLRDAGLTTLKERRERGDAIQTFKVLRGFSRVSRENWFQLVPGNARPTRANAIVDGNEVVKKDSMLVIERARLEIRRNFFTTRAATTWNGLPENVKNCTSINGFKTAYDRWKNFANLDDEGTNTARLDSEEV